MNMVTGKTVEAFANEVGRHRMVRGSDTAQVPPALNRPKAISVRRDRHPRRVNNDGRELVRSLRRVTRVNPMRIG